jgi:hypothetical protein
VAGSDTYSWTVVPADALILSGQNTSSIVVKWGNTSGDIQVIAENECGSSPAAVLPVVVNMPPTNPEAINGPSVACINTQVTYTSVYNGGSVMFNWSVPADATIMSGQGSDTIVVQWGITAGNVDLFVSNDCGSGPVVTKAVGINTIPEPAGVITGKDTVCQGQGNYVYSIPALPGTTEYIWTLPEGVTVSAGQGTNQVTLLMSNTAQSGNILVKGANECGSGTESAKALVVKNCTGIGQNDLAAVVRIYPNPVKDELTISINTNEKALDLAVTDIHGRVVVSEKLTLAGSDYKKKMDVSLFSRGVYFIRLSSGEKSYSEKVVVQ